MNKNRNPTSPPNKEREDRKYNNEHIIINTTIHKYTYTNSKPVK